MKTRRIIVAALIALVAVGAWATFAFAAPATKNATVPEVASCAAMHKLTTMPQMHAQMPAALKAECDAMHGPMAPTGQLHGSMGATMSGLGGMGVMTDGSMLHMGG